MYLRELDQPYTRYGLESKRDFYTAALISIDAAIAYAARFAELAKKMAEKESKPKRKQELERIADIVSRVPLNPAGDWWEALQSMWMVHALVHCEIFNVGNCPSRFDQYMYPFYKKSVLDEKTMSREFALELLECVWIKVQRMGDSLKLRRGHLPAGPGPEPDRDHRRSNPGRKGRLQRGNHALP